MEETVIEVEGLRRSYGRLEAVRGVSLRVRRGELFALLGTNGAGKTTTIEVLEGLQAPTAGRVRVLGMDPAGDRVVVRPRTGMMLQSGGFTGALTVTETVELWRSSAMSVVAPLAIGIVLAGEYEGGEVDGITRMASVLALVAVFVVHHHLVTVYASRRQELVLKRLRAGLPSDGTILVGAAVATLAIFLAQAVILAGYGVLALGLPTPENPLVILLALALGAAVMAAFSAALSAVTGSSEAAMLTSLPTAAVFLATPGAMIPLGTLPDGVEAVARYLPPGPFTEVVREGWLGHDVLDMLSSLGVLSIWLVLASLLAHAVFRWEPRTA